MTQLAPDPPGYEPHADPRAPYRVCRFAFGLAAIALGIQAAEIALFLYVMFSGDPRLEQLLAQPAWRFWIGPPITFGAAIASYLLVGRFPNDSWNRRAVILAAMNTFDIALWFSDHAHEFNALNPVVLWIQSPLVREAVHALQWFELALFMSLASDLIRHLGRGSAIKLQRSGRTTALFGFFAWLISYWMVFARAKGWMQIHNRRFFRQYFMLQLLSRLMLAITAFQATALCVLASRECARFLTDFTRAEREREYQEGFGNLPDSATPNKRDPWA